VPATVTPLPTAAVQPAVAATADPGDSPADQSVASAAESATETPEPDTATATAQTLPTVSPSPDRPSPTPQKQALALSLPSSRSSDADTSASQSAPAEPASTALVAGLQPKQLLDYAIFAFLGAGLCVAGVVVVMRRQA
jgi:hypothetical protein